MRDVGFPNRVRKTGYERGGLGDLHLCEKGVCVEHEDCKSGEVKQEQVDAVKLWLELSN